MERQGCCPLCKTTVLNDEVAINLNNSIIEDEGEDDRSPTITEIDTNTTATAEPTTPTVTRDNR